MKLNSLAATNVLCFATILVLILSAASARAQGYPEPVDDYANDYANVLTQGDVESLRHTFSNLEAKTGIEATVVTINSISDYSTSDISIESFATNLFNTWAIGNKETNDGILILVAVKDRQCRIELGRGYGRLYDPVMKQIIDEKMIPYFKTGEYSRGIYRGSHAIIEKVTTKGSWVGFYKWHILIFILIIVCIFAGVSCMRSGKKGWGWAFFAAAGALLFFLLLLLRMSSRVTGGGGGFGGGSSFGGGASGSW